MNAEATTRAEYEAAFAAMDGQPIMGRHVIGMLTVEVGARRWIITDGVNTKHGPVTSGPSTRGAIRLALSGWLDYRGIR